MGLDPRSINPSTGANFNYTAPKAPYTAGTVATGQYRATSDYRGTGAPSGYAPTPQAVANAPGAFDQDTQRKAYGDLVNQFLQHDALAQQNAWQSAQDQMGFTNSWYDQQRGFAGSDYQNQLDMLNWQRGGLADQINNANQNLAYRDQIIGNLQQMFGINDRNLANQIAQSVLDQQVRASAASLAGLQDSQKLRSAGIAGGSMFFPGQGIGQTQISDSTANTLRGINEGAGLTQEGYRIGAEKERLGLNNNILGQQMSRLGDLGNVQDLGRAGSKFDIQERNYRNSYNQQLVGKEYQRQQALNQINSMLNSQDQNQVALAQQLKQFLGMV